MKMTTEYFNANADYIVELEDYDGARLRKTVKHNNIDSYINKMRGLGYGLSDIDIACPQTDSHIKQFLNRVYFNWKKNCNFSTYTWKEVLEAGLRSELEC